jgi:hypothetical protein
MINTEEKWFPCPVCLRLLDVRTSKRKKPYVICSTCGVQMFIRERAGIEAFDALVVELIITNRLTGSVTGYRCPLKNCRGIVLLDAPSEVTRENGKERNAQGSLASKLGKLIK